MILYKKWGGQDKKTITLFYLFKKHFSYTKSRFICNCINREKCPYQSMNITYLNII